MAHAEANIEANSDSGRRGRRLHPGPGRLLRRRPRHRRQRRGPRRPGGVSGDITVLTHKTDLAADGTLARYAAEFTKIYPNVHVKFEPVVDYEGDVKIRLNSSDYGDVLMIPASVPVADYPKFFAPLGTPADLSQKYRFIDHGTYNGQVYGMAINGNATGMVYNKTVWQQAGITSWPTTPDQFIADLQTIKAKTQATPLYTIYHEGWPMTAWQAYLGELSCDPKASDDLASGHRALGRRQGAQPDRHDALQRRARSAH